MDSNALSHSEHRAQHGPLEEGIQLMAALSVRLQRLRLHTQDEKQLGLISELEEIVRLAVLALKDVTSASTRAHDH